MIIDVDVLRLDEVVDVVVVPRVVHQTGEAGGVWQGFRVYLGGQEMADFVFEIQAWRMEM